MKSIFIILLCISPTVLARGSSYGGWPIVSYLFFGVFFIGLFYGAYKAHGLAGFIPILLWLISVPLSFYLILTYDLPWVLYPITFTGVWWFDPLMKKIGVRDKDYEP
jgi:hypothetical protein